LPQWATYARPPPTVRGVVIAAPRDPLPFDPVEEAHRHWTDHGWQDAADGMAMVTSITRVQQILQARIDEVLRPLELTFARYELLMLLRFSRAGKLPLRVIGARLQVHPASVTSAVDRLEAQGFVERQAHPTDRRTRLAAITDRGDKVASEGTDRLNEQVFTRMPLSDEDLQTLHRLLRTVRHDAGDF
jgi:DNA-binding MarR family transcriptional regulator